MKKRPTLKQMRERPTLWFNELDFGLLIIYTSGICDKYYDDETEWVRLPMNNWIKYIHGRDDRTFIDFL